MSEKVKKIMMLFGSWFLTAQLALAILTSLFVPDGSVLWPPIYGFSMLLGFFFALEIFTIIFKGQRLYKLFSFSLDVLTSEYELDDFKCLLEDRRLLDKAIESGYEAASTRVAEVLCLSRKIELEVGKQCHEGGYYFRSVDPNHEIENYVVRPDWEGYGF